jgi:hypothetical protein
MSCGDPNTTHRDLDVHDPDTSRYFYQCLPGGDPAKGARDDSVRHVRLRHHVVLAEADVYERHQDLFRCERHRGRWRQVDEPDDRPR